MTEFESPQFEFMNELQKVQELLGDAAALLPDYSWLGNAKLKTNRPDATSGFIVDAALAFETDIEPLYIYRAYRDEQGELWVNLGDMICNNGVNAAKEGVQLLSGALGGEPVSPRYAQFDGRTAEYNRLAVHVDDAYFCMSVLHARKALRTGWHRRREGNNPAHHFDEAQLQVIEEFLNRCRAAGAIGSGYRER